MKKLFLAISIVLASIGAYAQRPSLVGELTQSIQARFDKAPATSEIESAFSPDAGAERLVLKVINSAQKSIHLAAYSFTSPKIVHALQDAKKRGVEVQAVVDGSSAKSKSGVAALNLLVNAGIPTRINSTYAIHHDKYIVVDGTHVQTGSFNYSKAAAEANSENVIVIWHNPKLADSYLWHWESRFRQGVEYKSPY